MNKPLRLTNEILSNLTIDQAKQLLNKDIYIVEIDATKDKNSYIICNNEHYCFNNKSVFPYKKIDYNLLYLNPNLIKNFGNEYIENVKNTCGCNITSFSEESFLENIKKTLEGVQPLLINQAITMEYVPNGKYIDIDEQDLINILNSNYEVVFVVQGYIKDVDEPIGDIECNGVIEEEDKNFHLYDGRAYFSVQANSPEEAFAKASELFENMDVGECQIYDSKLEHICLNGDDQYWYLSDLDIDNNFDR